MSVVVAVQKDGVVYMGCDSQTSIGSVVRDFLLDESEYKITRFEDGVLVGVCGASAAHSVLNCHGEIFKLDGELTKKKMVFDVVPKIRELMKKHKFVDDEGDMTNSFVVAHKDKIYAVSHDCDVMRITDFFAQGSGRRYAYYPLMDESLPVRERILRALRESAKRCDGVDAPYVLIDTKNLEYEVVEE